MTSSQPIPKSGLKKALSYVAKLLLVLVIFYFIYLQFTANWNEIKAYEWNVNNYGYLLLSIICALAAFFVFSSTWNMIVRGFGESLGTAVAFKISYLSNLGRYIPGKIWQLFGIIYIAGKHGLSAEKATASFIISQLFITVSSLLILALAAQMQPLLIVDQISFLGERFALLFALGMVIISLAIIIRPNRILGVCNYVLRKLSRSELTFSLDKKVAPIIFVSYCVAWTLYGAAFWLFIQAVVPSPELGIVSAVGIFAGAYQIGYLLLFAPGGLGPRELIMGQMLMPFLGGIAPAIALLSRLWTIIVEIIATLLALSVRNK